MRRPVLALLLGLVTAATATGCQRARAATSSDPAALERAFGVRVEGIRRSAGGYMLDFRFRVLDERKAQPLFDRNVRPYLVHPKSGARLLVPSSPKIGPMRSRSGGPSAPLSFIVFANPGQMIAAGDEVAVVIGSFRADKLIVQ
jgi:hypothetical protein